MTRIDFPLDRHSFAVKASLLAGQRHQTNDEEKTMKRTTFAATIGQRVLVSDSGPTGWTGHVVSAGPGWLTVRHDHGGRHILDVTRRTIEVCEDEEEQEAA